MADVDASLRRVFEAGTHEQVVTVAHRAARAVDAVDLPAWLAPAVREALLANGIDRLYRHQALAFELLTPAPADPDEAGGASTAANLVVSTGTASGKSLCFTLPVAQALAEDPHARALFLYPTKALAQDQARKLTRLVPHAAAAIYDGDTPQSRRRQIRKNAAIVLSNPDMLHLGILPSHERWADFFHQLRFVVLDEAHVYRGVFGSHVAQVVRRLLRICDYYRSQPRFILASATMAQPKAFAERLTGLPFVAIEQDAAPHPEQAVVLWNPPLEDPALGTRRSSLVEASALTTDIIRAGARVITFAPARKAAELVYTYVDRRLRERRRPDGEDAAAANASAQAGVQPTADALALEDPRDHAGPEASWDSGLEPDDEEPAASGAAPAALAEAAAGSRRRPAAARRPASDPASAHALPARARDQRVLPYRAGYTPQQRREIERRLFDHELDAVIATSALELGIDVGSLDAAVVIGFPGTITSLLQRWGRAGRGGRGWGVMVAGQDALDQFFMREPERLLSRPVEEAIVDLRNPHILDRHLESAAYELPLTLQDERYFGEEGARRADCLAAGGRLRESPSGLVWAKAFAPAAEVNLRTIDSAQFTIVDERTGDVIGTVERQRVFRTAHPGAVYMHLGESYVVKRLDLDELLILVGPATGDYYTQPKADKNVLIAGQAATRPLGDGVGLFFGNIEVAEQVIAYQKRSLTDQRVIDTVSLDLPEQVFQTQALWFTLTEPVLTEALGPEEEAGEGTRRRAGSLHAAEHTLIAMLPLYAMCDRWDVGGLSTAWHWQTDQATIFIYDGYPGGIGLSRRGYQAFVALAADAAALVQQCPCESGCPSCVQSPKCGNLNDPLDKAGGLALLRAVVDGAREAAAAGDDGAEGDDGEWDYAADLAWYGAAEAGPWDGGEPWDHDASGED